MKTVGAFVHAHDDMLLEYAMNGTMTCMAIKGIVEVNNLNHF